MNATRPAFAMLLIAAVAAAALLGLIGADAHPGHIQKKLFPARWYDTSVFLETSFDHPNALTCDGNFNGCATKWLPPIYASLGNWNNQASTAAFAADTNYDENEDVVVRVMDQVLGDPNILGIALTWNAAGTFCPLSSCGTFRWGEAWIGDDGHAGIYATGSVRQATIGHELGHLLSLRHESVDPNETQLYECGTDNTGPIPISIMSYDCIDPPGAGGSGIYLVQPFDTCGVNHAYFEPGIGFANCPTTPTPTPTPTPPPTPTPTPSPTPVPVSATAWGNVDCGGGIGSVDALKVLRFGAALSVSQTEPCTDIGTLHPVVTTHNQGDVDCNGSVSSVDSLKLLRFAAALSVAQTEPCPTIGDEP